MNKSDVIVLTAIGIMTLLAIISPLTLAFAANDRDKVIKAANEGKDEKFAKTCVKAGGVLTETACDLSQNP